MSTLNVVLAAEESAGVQALRQIDAGGHRPVAVMSSREGAGGEPLRAAAAEAGAALWPAEAVQDPSLADRLRGEGVDLLLNVHSLHLVHPDVLAAPRIGSFNLHPGPLPDYAGLNVPSWAIYRGETHHGVTLHWMAAEIDAGPIAYAASFEIVPSDTGLSLTGKCVRHGAPLISRLLKEAAVDPHRIPAAEQDMSRRRYFGPEPPHGGRLPLASPARQVVDLVRASDYLPFASPWGHPTTRLGGEEIGIVKASLTGEPTDAPPGSVGGARGRGMLVAAADDWVLVDRVLVGGEPSDAGAVMSRGDRLASDG